MPYLNGDCTFSQEGEGRTESSEEVTQRNVNATCCCPRPYRFAWGERRVMRSPRRRSQVNICSERHSQFGAERRQLVATLLEQASNLFGSVPAGAGS